MKFEVHDKKFRFKIAHFTLIDFFHLLLMLIYLLTYYQII